jgi:hypothetical protein
MKTIIAGHVPRRGGLAMAKRESRYPPFMKVPSTLALITLLIFVLIFIIYAVSEKSRTTVDQSTLQSVEQGAGTPTGDDFGYIIIPRVSSRLMGIITEPSFYVVYRKGPFGDYLLPEIIGLEPPGVRDFKKKMEAILPPLLKSNVIILRTGVVERIQPEE